AKHRYDLHNSASAPVAQLDRAPGYELGGREFESLRARHTNKKADAKASAFLFVARQKARRQAKFPALPRAPFTKRRYDIRSVRAFQSSPSFLQKQDQRFVIPAEAGIHADAAGYSLGCAASAGAWVAWLRARVASR